MALTTGLEPHRHWLPRLGALTAAGLLLFQFGDRQIQFRAEPTLSLAMVSHCFEQPARRIQLATGGAVQSILLPDVGGMLLWSPLRVHDLGGLCDRAYAVRLATPRAVRDTTLADRRPHLLWAHDDFARYAAFGLDPRFERDYVQLRTYHEAPDAPGFRSGLWIRRELVGDEAHLRELKAAAQPR